MTWWVRMLLSMAMQLAGMGMYALAFSTPRKGIDAMDRGICVGVGVTATVLGVLIMTGLLGGAQQ